ncbi:MAG: hypothetical protein ACXQT3_04625 [Methermicoccaceae archaeon]
MSRLLTLIVLLLVLTSTIPCSMAADIPPPDDTVQSYLHALDIKRAYEASQYVYFNTQKMQFGHSPSYISMLLTRWETRYGKGKFNLTNLQFIDKKLSDDGMQAVLGVKYDIVSTNDPTKVLESHTEYYRLEYIGGWKIITTDTSPLELLPTDELPEPPAQAVGTSPIDVLADSAAYLLPLAVVLALVGFRLNSMEKKRRRGGAKRKGRSATAFLLPPEKTSKFVKVSTKSVYQTGKRAQLVVWIKNFTSVPYTDVEITATFPKTISLNTPVLKLGDIPPGKVAKKAWVITPKKSGVFVIDEPMVMFGYKGKRGIAMLEPIRLQAE